MAWACCRCPSAAARCPTFGTPWRWARSAPRRPACSSPAPPGTPARPASPSPTPRRGWPPSTPAR
uniref:Uncharacterized protein n=1 Tax=Arundo donax TaxID=35708 RepID=A0A0A9Q5X9_ARUDO